MTDSPSAHEQVPDVTTLTRKLKKLDPAGYDRFFKLYYRRLWAYLAVISNGDNGNIEEALQLTLVKVVQHMRIFKHEDEFWAWLAVLAKNAYRDCQRHQFRFTRLRKALQFNLVMDSEPRIEDTVESDVASKKLDHVLQLLNDAELGLIRQKYFDGSSYRQIAGRLGVSEKSIESKLARIRAKLRQLLLRAEADE